MKSHKKALAFFFVRKAEANSRKRLKKEKPSRAFTPREASLQSTGGSSSKSRIHPTVEYQNDSTDSTDEDEEITLVCAFIKEQPCFISIIHISITKINLLKCRT